LADLQQLAVGADGPVESPANCWSSLCDVNACLDAVLTSSSPSGYAVDALADRSLLPPPPGTTAIISPPERFYTVSIPFKQEFLAYEVRAVNKKLFGVKLLITFLSVLRNCRPK
jgi:hypothetical protein